jgi:V-type H+-transporting ATPase subunit d
MAEGMFYKVTAGYIEGIVRGYRNNLLTAQNYGNLTQCETIDGIHAHTLALLRGA